MATQTAPPKDSRTIEVQTDIKDVTEEIQPTPKLDRSMISHMGAALQSYTDWAYSPLCIAVLNKKTAFNQGMDKRLFVEAEVEVVLKLIKS